MSQLHNITYRLKSYHGFYSPSDEYEGQVIENDSFIEGLVQNDRDTYFIFGEREEDFLEIIQLIPDAEFLYQMKLGTKDTPYLGNYFAKAPIWKSEAGVCEMNLEECLDETKKKLLQEKMVFYRGLLKDYSLYWYLFLKEKNNNPYIYQKKRF